MLCLEDVEPEELECECRCFLCLWLPVLRSDDASMMGRISTFPPELDLRVSRELRDEDEVEYEEGMSVVDSVSAARRRGTVVESMCECSVVAVCDDARCYIVSRIQYEDLHSVLHVSRSQCVLGDVAVYTHNTIRLMRRSKIHTKCAEPPVAPPVQLCRELCHVTLLQDVHCKELVANRTTASKLHSNVLQHLSQDVAMCRICPFACMWVKNGGWGSTSKSSLFAGRNTESANDSDWPVALHPATTTVDRFDNI